MKCSRLLFGVLAVSTWTVAAGAADYAWQEPHAGVLPHGDLEWKPEAFEFRRDTSVRHIDYEGGRDEADGTTKQTPWKHHPWDPEATGQAKACTGVHTYVFKRGSIYRGSLVAKTDGKPGTPIRLTSDPSWGGGEAVLCGSDRIKDWEQGVDHPDIPAAEKVWRAKLEFAPRNLWWVDDRGTVTRIPLARAPNWKVSDPDDIKSEWWQWENPKKQWGIRTKVGRSEVHMGVDATHLTEGPAYYKDALIWPEYGWVMGTPYPTRVLRYDPGEHSLAFAGQWGGGAGSYHVPRHARYYLEDKPHYLDDPRGEFWFKKAGRGGELYLRLPDGLDPRRVRIEAGRRLNLIDSEGMSHVHISGLTFRFVNTWWDLDAPPMRHKDVDPACIRLLGSGTDLEIANCLFEHVHTAIRFKAVGDNGMIDQVVVRDNVIRHTDHGGIALHDGGAWGMEYPKGRLYDVKVLRNHLREIGRRPTRFGQGHAIDVECARTLEIAGNVLDRLYGSGIFVHGGKRSAAKVDRPLTRILIHHNKVTDSMLNNNDWGGIETWQGGPAYVFNNISGNPGGFKLWGHKLHATRPANSRFGHAFYMDGGYKQYYFNNIAWGKSSDPLSPLGNTAAFQEIHGYFAHVFNNTAYRFVNGSRRQAPQAGRNKYLGNVWQDIGHMVFRHADPKDLPADPNAADAGAEASDYEHESNAYARNIFHRVPERLAVFEPSGRWHGSVDGFRRSLAASGSIGDVGTLVETPPLRAAERHDFRPTPAAGKHGVRVFVPWGLHATVAEWPFVHAGDDPTEILDEHWNFSGNFVNRQDYHREKLSHLRAVNVTDSDYVPGPLDDWVRGALRLNGRDQYAVLAAEASRAEPDGPGIEIRNAPSDWIRFEAPPHMAPGRVCEVKLFLKKPDSKLKLRADLHWGRSDGGYGGMNCWGGDAKQVAGEGPYVFHFKPAEKPGLGVLTVVAWLTPTGEWGDQKAIARFNVPRAPFASGEGNGGPDPGTSSFLVEVYFRTEPGHVGGTLVERMADAGFTLRVGENGVALFLTKAGGKTTQLDGKTRVNDGAWHHVIAEADRAAGVLTLYVDGRADAKGRGLERGGSLKNDAALYVGGRPDGNCLAGTLDFARIALGTLADATTTIEELYAWQFKGPSLQDWNGRKTTRGERAAGAIDFLE